MKNQFGITLITLILLGSCASTDNSKLEELKKENAELRKQLEKSTTILDDETKNIFKHLYDPHMGVRHVHGVDTAHIVSLMLITKSEVSDLYYNRSKSIHDGEEIDLVKLTDSPRTDFEVLETKSVTVGNFKLWVSMKKVRPGYVEDKIKTIWVGSHDHSLSLPKRHDGTIHLPGLGGPGLTSENE